MCVPRVKLISRRRQMSSTSCRVSVLWHDLNLGLGHIVIDAVITAAAAAAVAAADVTLQD